MVATSQFSLTSICSGSSCKGLTYQWGLYVLNNQSTVQNISGVEWRLMTDLDNGFRTKINTPNLVIKGNGNIINLYYNFIKLEVKV